MNRYADFWSVGLLLAAVIIVDGPLLRETFRISGGGGNASNLANYRRDTPDNYLGPQSSQQSCFSMRDEMTAKKMYFLVVGILLVALIIYLFATK